MSIIKTLLLLAIMTALFMLVGYGIGGVTGMVLALGFGGITNLLAWWKSDKMVLRMSSTAHSPMPLPPGATRKTRRSP